MREFFKEKVFRTVIPRNVRLGEAPSHGMPGDPVRREITRRRGVLALAREVLAAATRHGRRCTAASEHANRILELEAQQVSKGAYGKTTRARQRPERADSRRARAAAHAPIEVDIDRLAPNDFQPRKHMDDARLEELAQSIRVERRDPADRRPQASAIVIRSSPANAAGAPRNSPGCSASRSSSATSQRARRRSLLEMALIENIQREDLNPIEEALAYRRLADEFHLTQEDIAAAVGKDRATVANCCGC